VLGAGKCDWKQSNRFGPIRDGIVGVNHKMSHWVILIRRKNLRQGR
jgi:hypothetical protein